MDEHDVIAKNTDSLVTNGEINRTMRPDIVMEFLRERKINGTLTFDIVNGGVRSIRLSEQTKIPEQDRAEIRTILKMD